MVQCKDYKTIAHRAVGRGDGGSGEEDGSGGGEELVDRVVLEVHFFKKIEQYLFNKKSSFPCLLHQVFVHFQKECL